MDDESIFAAAPSKGTQAERLVKIDPLDWLDAQLLRREAEEMLKIKRSPRKHRPKDRERVETAARVAQRSMGNVVF